MTQSAENRRAVAHRAIFLDKDGTLIRNVPYNVDPTKIELMPGAEALHRLQQAGYQFVMITNQAGVAHGFFDESALTAVWARLLELMRPLGIDLKGFYYCPHHPNAELPRYRCHCDCRKPAPGLLVRAAHELNIDLSQSWFLGDILDDVEAGNLAGCRTMLVDVGSEDQWRICADRLPDYRVSNLSDAVEYILASDIDETLTGHLVERSVG